MASFRYIAVHRATDFGSSSFLSTPSSSVTSFSSVTNVVYLVFNESKPRCNVFDDVRMDTRHPVKTCALSRGHCDMADHRISASRIHRCRMLSLINLILTVRNCGGGDGMCTAGLAVRPSRRVSVHRKRNVLVTSYCTRCAQLSGCGSSEWFLTRLTASRDAETTQGETK